jgi:DNA-binding MarR family transcriptional regulator
VEVTLPQHRLLVLVASGVNASNASRPCDRLQRLGLLTRRRSEADRRDVEVVLTATGREVLEAVNEHRKREVSRILAKVPAADAQVMTQAMRAFSAAADEPPPMCSLWTQTGRSWSYSG